MSLILNKFELDNKLNKKLINLHKINLIDCFKRVFELNKNLTDFLKDELINGFENDKTIGIGSESSGITTGQGTNPLLWEIGHFCYFYEYHCLKYFENNYKFFIDNGDIYDSFVTERSYRFVFREHSKEKIFDYLNYISNKIFEIIKKEITESQKYLLTMTLLHNHMHCESLIFSKKLLGYDNIFNVNIPRNISHYLNFEFVKIQGGLFHQGSIEGENVIAWDNELPRFKKEVSDFHISKYCVTEEIVLRFINDNGYKRKEFWSNNGWRYNKEKDLKMPFYWTFKNSEFKINDNNNIRDIIPNYPACHITWYEAEALCKYLGGRLPTESEWEYVATNGGKTIFPWGNKMISNLNLNYSGSICDVSSFSDGDNELGVRQLFGNVWEWCEEPIYPYDGFEIDPIYREFSYPFFGFKKILRGGSWAVPDILINSRYRNAQMPDCKIQFTGVRVVKDII
jgi:iron(II)-dependent oxidoreductase